MNSDVIQNTDGERVLLIVEERYLSGVLLRLRYQPFLVFRRAILWGLIFSLFLIGIVAFRGPKPGTPSMFNIGFIAFCFASCFSVLREAEWRRLTITSKNLYLKFNGRREYQMSQNSIRAIDILSYSGSNLALRINWKQKNSDTWIIAGTVTSMNLEDFFNYYSKEHKRK